MRICTSVFAQNPKELLERIALAFSLGSDLVELRIDYLKDTIQRDGFHRYASTSVIACRPTEEGGMFQGSENERIEVLRQWLGIRPAYVDIELKMAEDLPTIVQEIRRNGSTPIVSWHHFEKTPPTDELRRLVSRMVKFEGVAKVVTKAIEFSDNTRILSLYRSVSKGKVIAFCMGEEGSISRILCTRMGSPFTYSSLPGLPVAPGQIPVDRLRNFYDLVWTEA